MEAKDKNQLRVLIDSAKSVLSEIRIEYFSPMGPRTRNLLEISNKIIPLIKTDYPDIAQILNNAISKITFSSTRVVQIPQYPFYQNVTNEHINAYSFGDIRTTIKILSAIYFPTSQTIRKVFISHSSKDRKIVTDFVDRILVMGIGFSTDDIFCTSIEDMNIKNGEDIRNHIKANILSSDFSFLLISDNYKKSEICLNEMGAVWANDNNVRYFLLPNTNFDEIGWLCNTKQAEPLVNSITLDKLYKELADYYNIEGKFDTWSRQRSTFVENI